MQLQRLNDLDTTVKKQKRNTITKTNEAFAELKQLKKEKDAKALASALMLTTKFDDKDEKIPSLSTRLTQFLTIKKGFGKHAIP